MVLRSGGAPSPGPPASGAAGASGGGADPRSRRAVPTSATSARTANPPAAHQPGNPPARTSGAPTGAPHCEQNRPDATAQHARPRGSITQELLEGQRENLPLTLKKVLRLCEG